jgi:hypothetical protein
MKIDDPQERAKHRIRQLIWLYFWLLLIEGALRKWVVPQPIFSNPLLIVRDPVAFVIYCYAIRAGVFPRNWWVVSLLTIGLLCFLATFAQLMPYIPPKYIALVAGYGFHANYFHLPLIFVMASVLRPEDIRRIGKWILLVLVPMSILMILQFHSGPDSFVNRTAGGEGEMITAGMGKVRTAGPFSFVTGVVAYFSLATGYLIWGVLRRDVYKGWLLAAAALALVVGIAVSGSRSVVGACVVVVAVILPVFFLRPDAVGRFGRILVVTVVLGFIVSRIPFVREGIHVLTNRFTEVAEASDQTIAGNVASRVFGGFKESLFILSKGIAPLLGFGLGIGTNAGAKLLTGRHAFLLTEDEWSRIFLESGPILGVAYVAWRVALAFRILWLSFKSVLLGNLLPILLFASGFLPLISGEFGQPTILGFVVFSTGLALAARNEEEIEMAKTAAESPDLRAVAAPPVRRRSPFAERLHSPESEQNQSNGAVDR